jgi:hypothetical protein
MHGLLVYKAVGYPILYPNEKHKKENMCKTSGAEGCQSKNAVFRHGVFALTGPRMLIFTYTSFHVFIVNSYFHTTS